MKLIIHEFYVFLFVFFSDFVMRVPTSVVHNPWAATESVATGTCRQPSWTQSPRVAHIFTNQYIHLHEHIENKVKFELPSWWRGVRVWYLQCMHTGDTAVCPLSLRSYTNNMALFLSFHHITYTYITSIIFHLCMWGLQQLITSMV